jgi:hypothetical protein
VKPVLHEVIGLPKDQNRGKRIYSFGYSLGLYICSHVAACKERRTKRFSASKEAVCKRLAPPRGQPPLSLKNEPPNSFFAADLAAWCDLVASVVGQVLGDLLTLVDTPPRRSSLAKKKERPFPRPLLGMLRMKKWGTNVVTNRSLKQDTQQNNVYHLVGENGLLPFPQATLMRVKYFSQRCGISRLQMSRYRCCRRSDMLRGVC